MSDFIDHSVLKPEDILLFDPVRNMIDFIRDCRKNGMDQSKTIDEIVDHLNYLPTEAEIIVNEFWDKAA